MEIILIICIPLIKYSGFQLASHGRGASPLRIYLVGTKSMRETACTSACTDTAHDSKKIIPNTLPLGKLVGVGSVLGLYEGGYHYYPPFMSLPLCRLVAPFALAVVRRSVCARCKEVLGCVRTALRMDRSALLFEDS